jgi:hypothetical protein
MPGQRKLDASAPAAVARDPLTSSSSYCPQRCIVLSNGDRFTALYRAADAATDEPDFLQLLDVHAVDVMGIYECGDPGDDEDLDDIGRSLIAADPVRGPLRAKFRHGPHWELLGGDQHLIGELEEGMVQLYQDHCPSAAP